MKVKRFILLGLLLWMVLCIQSISYGAMQNPEVKVKVQNTVTNKTGWIEVKGTVLEGFDRSIMINIFSESGYNSLFTVNKINGFTLKQKVPIGKYKVDFISVFGDTTGKYRVDSQRDIEIKADVLTQFSFVVAGNDTKHKEKYKTVKNNLNQLENSKKTQKEAKFINDSNTPSQEQSEAKKYTFKIGNSYIFTIILAVILILVVVIIKFKT